MGRWLRARCNTSSPWCVQADRASSGFEHSARCVQGKNITHWGAGVGTSARYTNEEGVADSPSPLRQSSTRGLYHVDTHGCVLSLKEHFCVPSMCLQSTETFFREICSTALPVELLLFIGTGPGRPGRNYLSLGHAWCLAEHTISLLHGSC